MQLTNRAEEYILKLKKDSDWSSSKEELERYFKKQNVAITSELINFQINFSGLELKIGNVKRDTFRLYLFSKDQIQNDEPLEYDKIDNHLAFICGDHQTAQFRFYITEDGKICTIDNSGDLNILYSKIEKKIEQYALKDEIQNWHQNSNYFRVKDQFKLEQIMNNGFKMIPETSDDYASWWGNGNLIIYNGTWLDRKDRFLHVYGLNEVSCNQIIEALQQKEVIE